MGSGCRLRTSVSGTVSWLAIHYSMRRIDHISPISIPLLGDMSRCRWSNPMASTPISDCCGPVSWLRQLGASINESCEIELPELCLRGNGRLVAIEPCPELTGGDGSVVTGTFELSSRAILNLSVDDSPTPWASLPTIRYGLRTGEILFRHVNYVSANMSKTLNGIARVRAISSVSRAAPVYNLEVLGEHVYHVGGNGLLV